MSKKQARESIASHTKKSIIFGKRCVACEGGVPRLPPAIARAALLQLKGWSIVEEKGGAGTAARIQKLRKDFKFRDFKAALSFVNKIGKVAEREGHHPDISFTWGKAQIEIYTHAVGGLTENDFILARLIGQVK